MVIVPMKPRQVVFAQLGNRAFVAARKVAAQLPGSFVGQIPSSAGDHADESYLVTDAPVPTVRRLAARVGLTIKTTKPGQIPVRRNPSATIVRANPRTRRTPRRANPPATRVAMVLSTRVIDLSYLHAEAKRTPYRHTFNTGVTCQLLTDGSVRLVRPDGKPLWKSFT